MSKRGEVERQRDIFAYVLWLVAFEVVMLVMHPGPSSTRSVGIFGFLLLPLGVLEQLLWYNLRVACVAVHRAFGVAEPADGFDVYEYSALSEAGYLRIFGPRAAGGITVTVSILLACRRHGGEDCWMGLMLEPNLVYIMLTRATDRVHVVVEDLSAGVRLPSGGVFREQGLQLGLHLSQVQPHGVSVPAGMCKN